MPSDPSKWWYGNALALLLVGLTIVMLVMNILANGAELTATGVVIFWFGSIAVGYLSIFTFYIDVRKIRTADVEYNPKAWLYVLGYLILSPFVASAVYLWNRRKTLNSPQLGKKEIPRITTVWKWHR